MTQTPVLPALPDLEIVNDLEESFHKEIPCMDCGKKATWELIHQRSSGQCRSYLCAKHKKIDHAVVTTALAMPYLITLRCKTCKGKITNPKDIIFRRL